MSNKIDTSQFNILGFFSGGLFTNLNVFSTNLKLSLTNLRRKFIFNEFPLYRKIRLLSNTVQVDNSFFLQNIN
jgi:hypothetical protein